MRKDLRRYFRGESADAVDLVSRILQFNPADRLSVVECLDHPYFAAIHDVEDEVG